jgi:zinc and cadmium transporter
MAITLSLFCLAIVTASVLGGLLPLATVLNHTRLQVYLSFSAGAMLGAAFFHMLPEAVKVGSAGSIPWAAIGLLALFFLERFFSFHHHEPHANAAEMRGADAHSEHPRLESSTQPEIACSEPGHRAVAATAFHAAPWASAAFGLAVHSLVGGFALASAVAADFQIRARLGAAGLGVFVATLVHKPADALTVTSLMVRAGSARWSAQIVNLGFGFMIPAGVVLYALGLGGVQPTSAPQWTGGALAFSAGTFLCVALADLLPELQFHAHDRFKLSLALLAGFALMAGAAVVAPE